MNKGHAEVVAGADGRWRQQIICNAMRCYVGYKRQIVREINRSRKALCVMSMNENKYLRVELTHVKEKVLSLRFVQHVL